MSADRIEIVSQLFERARLVPVSDRAKFLQEACGADSALLSEVQSLLDHHENETGLLERSAVASSAARAITSNFLPAKTPDRIGRYKIIRKLGEGGMGVVYLAEQDQPAREVAIKVIRFGLTSREMLRRFELETKVLGRLQHPCVAQIYEAGIDETDSIPRPYFVMEYVEGQALDTYIRENAPSVPQRLHLFTQICDAVHHAHQKGVIHRDLKPSNMIVVPLRRRSAIPR